MQLPQSSTHKIAFFLFFAGLLVFSHAFPAHAAVYVSNVKALYHFENSVNDSSTNGYDFTATGGAYATGKLGSYAWDSSSTDDTVNNLLATSSVISNWGDFAIGYWVNAQKAFTDAPGYGYVLTTDTGTVTSVNFGYNRLCVNSFEYKVITTCQAATGIDIGTSTWHWVLLERNGNSVDFYVDNQLKENKTVSGNFSANSNIRVNGQYSDHKGLHFLIDELFFANAAISTSTRNSLYNNGTGDTVCLTAGCDSTSTPVSVTITTSTPAQYHANGKTTIGVGSSTSQSVVQFSAIPSSNGTSTIQLWVEVESSTTAFANTATATSTYVNAGNTASTTVTLPNGNYHWQVKAVDQNNVSSTWYQFSPNATGTDFVVGVATTSLEISDGSIVALYHFGKNAVDASNNGYDFTATGGGFGNGIVGSGSWDSKSTNDSSNHLLASSSVISNWGDFSIGYWVNPQTAFSASPGYGYVLTTDTGTVTSANFGYNRLCVNSFEYKLVTTCQSATGIDLGTSTWHWVLLERHGSSTDFYVDNVLKENKTISGTFSANSDIRVNGQYSDHQGLDFLMDELFFSNTAISTSTRNSLWNYGAGAAICLTGGCAPTISSGTLTQYQANGTTPVDPGGTTPDNSAKFAATITVTSSRQAYLQVEVQQAGVAFTNTPNATGTLVSSGTSTATYTGLLNRSYHWQARVVDTFGVASPWQYYGSNANSIDFRVSSLANAASEYFNGSSSLTYSAASDTFGATSTFSIEFWYRTPEPTSSIVSLIDTRTSSTREGYFVNRDMDNGMQFYMNCASGNIGFHAASATVRVSNTGGNDKLGTWHQVAITKNSGTASSAFAFYYDGTSTPIDWAGGGPISGNCYDPSSTNSIWFGQDTLSTSTLNYLTGNLDEVRIWNIAKSSASVASEWNQEVISSGNLLSRWSFNANSTELINSLATSSQTGSPSFASSTPFGHFLEGYSSVNTSTDQLVWASSTQYIDNWNAAVATWNALNPISISSTAVTSTANLIITDASDSSVFGAALYCNKSPLGSSTFPCPFSTNKDTIFFNVPNMANSSTDPNASTEWQATAVHELGHSLGLDHSYFGNIMYPFSGTLQTSTGLQDITDYRFLWGD